MFGIFQRVKTRTGIETDSLFGIISDNDNQNSIVRLFQCLVLYQIMITRTVL